MHDRATLLALADRVEAASGPDFALGVEVLLAVGRTGREVNPLFSLDAALSLKGWLGWRAICLKKHKPWFAVGDDGPIHGAGRAVTQPLSATAAALRALAQEAPGDE